MSVDPTVPAAPAEDPQNTAAPGSSDPAPAPVASVAPAAAESMAERNRRAAEGRKTAALERTVAQLTQTVNALGTQLSLTEQRRLNEELAQLDPIERLQREIEMLKGRTAGTQSQPAPIRTSTPQPDVEYTQNRSQEIIDAINAELGTDLKVDDPGLNWDDEAPFQASAYRLAAQKVRTQASGAVPVTPALTKGDDMPKQATEEEIEARVTATLRREMGLSSPASPQPNSPRASAGSPTEEDFQKTVQGYNSKLGPKATIEKLRAQREAAAKAAGL